MITVDEATSLILGQCHLGDTAELLISNLSCEILRENIYASAPMPPFDRVAMDGIAILFSDWQSGQYEFVVDGVQAAGLPRQALTERGHCFEVMTGAVLPEGCDTVIRMEDIHLADGRAKIAKDLLLLQFQNIHSKGSDHAKGDLLISEGAQLLAPQWSIAASVGKSKVLVSQRPKIAIVSTGSELVEVSEQPLPHQIRRSNCYAILSSLQNQGFDKTSLYHLSDDRNLLFKRLGEIISENDFVILSGGVSMGKFDFIPDVLTDLHVKNIFHKVAQRPGKPLWFGVGEKNQKIFGLPGNPVSTMICLHRYVLPALWASMGRNKNVIGQRPLARLTQSISFKISMTLFHPAKINFSPEGMLLAEPIQTNGSGDFSSLALADGFIELTQNKSEFQVGDVIPFWLWKESF